MFVIKVIPITRGVLKGHVSFFSKESIDPGTVIDVPIRNKKTAAVVLSTTDVRDEKSTLRNESFALKKIQPKVKRRIFTTGTIEAFREIAEYHAAPESAVFDHFTSRAIVDTDNPLEETKHQKANYETASDRLALQQETPERMSLYRNLTRESFAKGESVMILAPTIPEAERLYKELSRGIEEQTVLLTSNLTKKGTVTAWNRAIADPEPLLLIVTFSFLAIPRENLSTIIIERESARSYVHRERPYLDARVAAEVLAKKNGARVIFSDFPLRVETHARLKNHELEELSRPQRSLRIGAPVRVVDARTKDDGKKKKRFSPLTLFVQSLIEKETARGSRLFVYAARRGIAPLTICNDCGTPITDPATGAPMTLHKTPEGNMFMSFRSGALLPANIACSVCGSWDLVSLGVGVERVHDEIKKLFPSIPLFLFTSETAKTHAQSRKLMQQFFSTKGAVLVATDRALPYLYEPVEYSVVASIDSALSSSAWRANAHALHTLFYLSDKTLETCVVQTRLPEAPVIRALAAGNPSDFIEHELSEREQFDYPPYATFVGLTWSGTERAVLKTADVVTSALTSWELVGPLPPRAISKNRFAGRAVVRLEKGTWPNQRLSEDLHKLPPDIAVTIDPDDIV